ncbi:hypothetical protein DRE_03459 [Drechslerella stenobrocha 248]|uniref:Long-chain-alcohol oxidase n=1 Tax=Drechslerella stenobrocha 248 TaxID=1043628 RepID=W7IDL6_9PEZI|nr:hypothetical protein DRE_03459 [Drechslerella stenobrocha 248]
MATETATYRFARPSEKCVFDDAQWNMLVHILETFVSKLTPEETAELKEDYYKRTKFNPVEERLLDAYAKESLVDVPEVLQDIDTLFQNNVPADKVAEIQTVLNILDTRLGSLAFTGSTVPMYEKTRQEREQIVLGWSTARMQSLRKLFKSFQALSRLMWARFSPTFHAACGFPGFPFTKECEEDYKLVKEAAAAADTNPDFKFEDLSQVAPQADGVIRLSTSILVIGSGCGGGVVAGHLSKALPHHSVMVVEKGFWYPVHKAPTSEREGLQKLYEEGGALQTNDGSLSVLAGKTWGGGSAINWGVSWQLPARTRKEWSEKFGLKFADSPEFQDCFDYVCQVGQVKSWNDSEHNPSNAIIATGSHRLGERYISVPQNIEGAPDAHSKICGAFCTLSCKGAGVGSSASRGGKLGVARTFLVEARDSGSKFVQGFDVEKILFDKNGNVTGVEGLWRADETEPAGTGKKVIINASRVICSGGSLNTPAILLRSGLRNYWIGRNLHLHPVVFCLSEWKEETIPWEGSIISVANTEHTNIDREGHGVVVEGMLMLPGFGSNGLPWRSALEYKKVLLRMRHLTNNVIIARDRDSGRILLDPKSGKCRVDYTVSEFDRGNLLEGLIATMKVNRAAGAEVVYPSIIGAPSYTRLEDKEADQKAFDTFIETIRKTGFTMENIGYGSAHQMGSCRMGSTPRMGACNNKGRVWEKNGLYVADASLMPSSSGVNPMVTTQGLAEWVSRGIVADILEQEGKGGKSKI